MRHYVRTLFLLLFLIEIFSLMPPWKENAETGANKSRDYLKGIIHVHSNLSDGGGTPAEIAEAAEKAGMDFVVLTDHNNTLARARGFEKRYGDTDLFVEMEASVWAGHILTFFSQVPDARKLSDDRVHDLAWKYFIGEESRPGIFQIVAHPSNIKTPWTSLDRFSEGIEVINFDSMWQREVYESVLGFMTTVLVYPMNNYLAALRFFQVYDKDFSAWDSMNLASKGHFAILAHDTHAKAKINDSIIFHWPDYLQTFKLASNIVFVKPPLPSDFEARKKILYHQLRSGRSAMVFQSIYPFDGNAWSLKCGNETYSVGDEAPFSNKCEFRVSFPEKFPYPKKVRLWKNGDMVRELETRKSSAILQLKGEGTYRLEVWAQPRSLFRILLNRDVPYLFYNPIYVK
jgi:hypothetical protein